MLKNTAGLSWSWIVRKVRGHFLAGVLIAVPIGVTIWVLVWIFSAIDGYLQPIIKVVLGRPVAGIGFGVTVVLIYLLGAIASNIVGKRLVQYGEFLVAKVPIVRPLYASIKQILESFSMPGKAGLGPTVLIEFPRQGVWSLGFITSELTGQPGETRLIVFIPTAPNPITGFVQIVKEAEVIRTDIRADKALQMLISAGKITPQEVSDRLSGRRD